MKTSTTKAIGAGAEQTTLRSPAAQAAVAASQAAATQAKDGNGASPAARKILTERNVAPAEVAGTGKDGRITKADALSARSSCPRHQWRRSRRAHRRRPTTRRARSACGCRGLRQTIARRLKDAQNTAAMLTTFNEVDMTQGDGAPGGVPASSSRRSTA